MPRPDRRRSRPQKSNKKHQKAAKKAQPEVATLVGYVRVSTDEQAAGGVSLAGQRSRLKAYAKALGYDVLRIEEDRLSGKLAPGRRPGLSTALEAVRSGEASGLIVFKLDRLSRSTLHVLKLADEAKEKGGQLLSVTEENGSTRCTCATKALER
jgi:DNA invertase Pin-like site-specific DNA recombinase